MKPVDVIEPAALSQRDAAAFIGVSVRAFRDLVATDPGVARARRYPTTRAVYVRSILAAWLTDARRGCPTTKARIA